MDDVLRHIEQEIPRLRRYARYLRREPDHADDLVQECLSRAIAKRLSTSLANAGFLMASGS